MATTGQQILERARYKANDSASATYTWTDPEALIWINDSQRAIVRLLHKSGATSTFATIAAGSSRQTLSGLGLTRAIAFIDVVCNVSGTTRGKPVRRCKRADLDDEIPAWHTATGTDVEHWVPDERDPTAIYIYPQVASGTPKLEVITATVPADLGALANNYGLDDIYTEAAQLYLLHAMFSKDITKLKSVQYAAQYWGMFKEALGLGDAALMRTAQEGNAKEKGA
jgi:hypothetical protein